MKIKRKLLIIALIMLSILFIKINKAEATLYLNELGFDAQINEDGSMNVTETWNINISETNTLFKTFEPDNSKYAGITDVKVKNLTTNTELAQIDTEMYHVTKDCYYGLKNSKGKYEIAWGVGLDNSSATRIYQISYKVLDAITLNDDCAELYWQFVGKDFEIDAKKITGTITLPKNAETIEDIKVWGHTEQLNGEIYATDLNKIEFSIDRYSNGNYVEVRTAFPTNIMGNVQRKTNKPALGGIIEEETRWADEANQRREREEKIFYAIQKIAMLATIIMAIIAIRNFIKLLSRGKKLKPTTELKYYREVPYENATPGEALYIISNGNYKQLYEYFPPIVLDLCLRKYIQLELVKEEKIFSKEEVKIIILEKDRNELKKEEDTILQLLIDVAGEKKELTTKGLKKYLEKNSFKITSIEGKIKEAIQESEESMKNINNGNQKVYTFYSTVSIIFAFFTFFTFALYIPLALAFLVNAIIALIITLQTDKLTQKGIDEKEQWKAFKKYMEDFSLLKDKEVPALEIWEKYLVYATAFGISKKVMKQLKIVYPEINNMDSSMLTTYCYINMMDKVNLGSCFSSSIYSATYSSGSGAGGGFSGGGGFGGGRRWWRWSLDQLQLSPKRFCYKKYLA